mgnify:CR=1 FL=1
MLVYSITDVDKVAPCFDVSNVCRVRWVVVFLRDRARFGERW